MSSPFKILQIVPRLPPYSDGVGDYARLLASQLATEHNIQTEFVTFRPGTKTPNTTDGFITHKLQTHTAKAFLSLLSKEIDGILLHYSNYPYLQGKLDAPFWLVNALKLAKKSCSLIVMYHELPTLKWKKLRILNPIQTKVSKRLAKIADTVVTDSHHFKTHLEKWTNSSVNSLPDFSTIGEPKPEQIRPLKDRKSRLVIFGGSDRKRAYQSLDSLLTACLQLNLSEVCDIGSPQTLPSDSFDNITFTEMGFQPAKTIREIFLDSVAGLIDYTRFPGDLGKSSVFAAFCAHGLMPISTAYNPSEADGIFPNKQYATIGEDFSSWSIEQQQQIADQAREWYSGHSLAANAKYFATYLRQKKTQTKI